MPRPQLQSALRYPLDEILGTRANVRLVRVLTLAGIPITAGELARRAKLGRTGVYPALSALERVGIVEFVGAGSTRQVKLRKLHPLALPIATLFRSEERRIDALVTDLRQLLEMSTKELISAWLNEAPPE